MKYYNYPNGTKTAEALDSENTAVVKGPDGKYIAPNELPAITANDKGKIVRVKADGSGIEYTGEAELPPITSSDGGKVCKVKSDHSGVEWGEASGNTHLYRHMINLQSAISVATNRLSLGIILYLNTNNKITTLNAFKNLLTSNVRMPVSGYIYDPSTGISGFVYQVYKDSEDDTFTVAYHRIGSSPTESSYNTLTVSDVVTQIL